MRCFKLLLIGALLLPTIIKAQIPDSLIVVNDTAENNRLKLGVIFASGFDFIDLKPDYYNQTKKVGYFAGLGLTYSLSSDQLELSSGFKFIRTKAFFTDTNSWVRNYGILPTSLMTSFSYNKSIGIGLSIQIGGSLITNVSPTPSGVIFEGISDRISNHFSAFIGIQKQVKLKKFIISPELRYNYGINSLKNYSSFDEVNLHFLSLLLHFTNV